MSEIIINLFKSVDIEQNDGDITLIAFRSADFLMEIGIEKVSIVKTG